MASNTGADSTRLRYWASETAAVGPLPGVATLTIAIRWGSEKGVRSMTASITLNMAALAPVPRAIMTSATAVKAGVRAIDRMPYRTSRGTPRCAYAACLTSCAV